MNILEALQNFRKLHLFLYENLIVKISKPKILFNVEKLW